MKNTRTFLVAGMTVAAVLVTAGCSSLADEQPSETGEATSESISMVLGVAGNPYYEALVCGAQAAADELGYELTDTAPATFSPSEQIPLINGVVASRPAAAIIAPTDPQALDSQISQLTSGGTAVVTVDTTIADPSGLATQVITDNEAGGRLAAQTLSELLGGSGKVLVIQGPQGNVVESARRTGFEDEIAKHPGIEYVGVQYSENDSAKAAQFITSTLASHPDLAGVFATNDLGAIGVVTGVQQAGVEGAVKVVAFDAATPQVNALRNGQIDALIAQQPAEMGRLAVDAAVRAINGEEIPADTVVDLVVVESGDDEAADTYEYKASC